MREGKAGEAACNGMGARAYVRARMKTCTLCVVRGMLELLVGSQYVVFMMNVGYDECWIRMH